MKKHDSVFQMPMYNLVTLGARGCDKTPLIIQFLNFQIDTRQRTCIIDGEIVFLAVCDNTGQEEYRGLYNDNSIIKGDGFLLIYSITSRKSFDEIAFFHEKILAAKETEAKGQPIPIIIVATDSELEMYREISTQEGKDLAQSLGCKYIECSAKDKTNVDEAFYEVVREIRRFEKQLQVLKKLESAEKEKEKEKEKKEKKGEKGEKAEGKAYSLTSSRKFLKKANQEINFDFNREQTAASQPTSRLRSNTFSNFLSSKSPPKAQTNMKSSTSMQNISKQDKREITPPHSTSFQPPPPPYLSSSLPNSSFLPSSNLPNSSSLPNFPTSGSLFSLSSIASNHSAMSIPTSTFDFQHHPSSSASSTISSYASSGSSSGSSSISSSNTVPPPSSSASSSISSSNTVPPPSSSATSSISSFNAPNKPLPAVPKPLKKPTPITTKLHTPGATSSPITPARLLAPRNGKGLLNISTPTSPRTKSAIAKDKNNNSNNKNSWVRKMRERSASTSSEVRVAKDVKDDTLDLAKKVDEKQKEQNDEMMGYLDEMQKKFEGKFFSPVNPTPNPAPFAEMKMKGGRAFF